MAEEKKKPDLKARLNRAHAGQAPAVNGPAPSLDAPTSAGFAPTPGFAPSVDEDVAAQGAGDPAGDLAVPEFIRQQLAEKAAADARAEAEARAAADALAAAKARAAAAADPFASSSAAVAPQDIRLVIDDKAVADSEVGRGRSGTYIAVAITALLALGGGLMGGLQIASSQDAKKTRDAIGAIRSAVDQSGTTIAQLKEKVDHAAAAAGVQSREDGEQQAAPVRPDQLRVDTDLTTWFGTQGSEPPLTPTTYAGRVGRLRPDLLQKLMTVQIGLQDAWYQLQSHQRITTANLASIRESMEATRNTAQELSRLYVVFTPGPQNGPRLLANLVQGSIEPTGVQLATPMGAGPATRPFYTGGDLTAPNNASSIIPVDSRTGASRVILSHIARPWEEYRGRVRALKNLVDRLEGEHRQLSTALNRPNGG